MAWDRYAAMFNNSLKYIDPNGHYSCEGVDQCKQNSNHLIYSAAELREKWIDYRIKNYYGLTLTGRWGSRNKENLYRALEKLNKALPGINRFTKGKTYHFEFNPTNYGGHADGKGNIDFHGWENGIPYQNFYHEVAHAIDDSSNDYFSNALNQNVITTENGDYVMGGPKEKYRRNSNGYTSDTVLDPTGVYVDAQQHPGDAPCAAGDTWCGSGNTSGEEWGDLVANYVSGNLDKTNQYGLARMNWVEKIWLQYFVDNVP